MLTNCSSDGALGSVGEGLKSNKQLKCSVSWALPQSCRRLDSFRESGRVSFLVSRVCSERASLGPTVGPPKPHPPTNAPRSILYFPVGNTRTSYQSCGIYPAAKSLATTLATPESFLCPPISVSSTTRTPHCKMLSSSHEIEWRERQIAAHRNRVSGRSSFDGLSLLAMDEKVEKWSHGTEDIDAVMLQSRNGA